MHRLRLVINPIWRYLAGAALGLVLFLAIFLWASAQPAQALPEYAVFTGESCATCHVNPGGGGPRTLRGLLWAAKGKPQQVPTLPDVLIAPGVSDGAELYDIACSSCHGVKGEGAFGMALVGTNIPALATRSYIETGIPPGMPGFHGQLTPTQLDALVDFITGLANGTLQPLPDTYPLPPARLSAGSPPAASENGGN
ncbi:MAG: cytochrome c [Chloroflexi bacterium]|nr:cytochrome c [Chloroflexota bacterium]